MELDLIEKFILLALDNKRGRFLIDSFSLNYGIAGAILLELSELNKISIQNKKLIVTDKKNTNNMVIDTCLNLINNSKKKRKTKNWIYRIGNRSTKFRRLILKDLYHKKILKINHKTYFFGLFNVYKYLVINTKPTDEIKSNLKKIVLENLKPDLESLLLLSLMNSCKLTHILFIDKKSYRASNKRIKELTQNVEISDAVSQTLKEIQTAVLVATTSAFVGAPSSN